MTADWARIPYDVLDRISVRIVNEVRGINRIVLRHHQQTPRNDRVGVTQSGCSVVEKTLILQGFSALTI